MNSQCLGHETFCQCKMYQFAHNLHVRQLRLSLYDIVIKFRFILSTLGKYV